MSSFILILSNFLIMNYAGLGIRLSQYIHVQWSLQMFCWCTLSFLPKGLQFSACFNILLP
jgi:hypothetical protein